MLLPVLTILLVAISLVALWANRGNFIAPAVLFSGGFAFCSFWALAYAAQWAYVMRPEAFAAVAGGVALFACTCAVVRKFATREGAWIPATGSWSGSTSAIWIVLFIVLQTIVGVWFVIRVRQMFPADSVATSIATYKYASTSTTQNTYLGFPLNPLRLLCSSAAYVVGYVFVATAISRRNIPLLVTSGLSVCANFILNWEGGGRTGLAVYAVYLATLTVLMLRESHQGAIVMSRRLAIVFVVAALLFAAAFRLLAIGRHTGFSVQSALDILSVYCGAEIPSLDLWMRTSRIRANDICGFMTFIRSITYLGPKLGIPAWTYTLDLPNVYSSWHWLGNVYTTFYAFLYDFDWPGLITLTVLMAVVSELIFVRCGRAAKARDLWMMLYAYLAPQLLLSFFSNKFYEEFMAVGFLRILVVIVAVREFLRLVDPARTDGNKGES